MAWGFFVFFVVFYRVNIDLDSKEFLYYLCCVLSLGLVSVVFGLGFCFFFYLQVEESESEWFVLYCFIIYVVQKIMVVVVR